MSGRRDEYEEETLVHSTFTWGRSGTTPVNSFLYSESGTSVAVGIRIPLTDATLEAVSVATSIAGTYNLEVYEYDGTTRTLITTIVVTAVRGVTVITASLALTTGRELQLKVVSGTAKNIQASCIIKGTL